ncbi:MAG: hypothetical protein JOY63_04760, partial [Acetobacteraceae bacterium]|nr:hypothetical protein [Acetobacteraceae bacterium]
MSGAASRRWVWLRDSDLLYSFRRSPVAIGSALVALACVVGAVFAPWL